MDRGPSAIGRYILPRALLWFRWAALATWGTGAWYLLSTDQLLSVFTLGLSSGDTQYALALGVGVWLGTILLINVWAILWPNQKKLMGLVTGVNEEDLARAKVRVATVARINAVLSLRCSCSWLQALTASPCDALSLPPAPWLPGQERCSAALSKRPGIRPVGLWKRLLWRGGPLCDHIMQRLEGRGERVGLGFERVNDICGQ